MLMHINYHPKNGGWTQMNAEAPATDALVCSRSAGETIEVLNLV